MAVILVVDDEPDIRLFVRLNLELDGHEVIDAGDGNEALAAVAAQPPDLILLDVMMPDVDGFAVLEQLKASGDREVKEIPVVMLTALSGPEDSARGGIEGAVRYLTKPIASMALRDAVDLALHGDPEPVQRRRAQQGALERLARLEKGKSPTAPTSAPRPRLGRLEATPTTRTPQGRAPVEPARLAGLTTRQREILDAVGAVDTVTAAAESLGMSRSNIYASLRRIGRKLDIASVEDLLERLRSGELDGDR